MTYYTGDLFVGNSLAAYGEYSPDEAKMLAALLEPDSVVIEVGANIGALTVALAAAVPQGRVYAYEAQPENYELLVRNTDSSKATVRATQGIVSSQEGEGAVPFLRALGHENFGAVELGDAAAIGRGAVEVRRVSLDAYHLDHLRRLDLIKIDVEGMEADVLRSARQLIQRHRPFLYVENDRSDKSKELIELLYSLGYIIVRHNPPLYDPNNWRGEKVNIWDRNIVSINLLCCPGDQADRGKKFAAALMARVDSVQIPADRYEQLVAVVMAEPDNLVAWQRLAGAMSGTGALVHGTLAALRRALELDPNRDKILLADMAYTLGKVGKLAEAAKIADELERRFPEDPAHLWVKSNIHSIKGRHDRALELAERTVQAAPGSVPYATHRAMMQLNAGHFVEGLRNHECRVLGNPAMGHLWNTPQWQGYPADHLLLVVDEGGGDLVSFARFLPLAASRCKKLSIAAQAYTQHFISSVLKEAENYEFTEPWVVPSGAQCWTTLMRVPAALGMNNEWFRKYPHPAFDLPKMVPFVDDGNLHVGIAWEGNGMSYNYLAKSFPVELFVDLLRVSGIALHSLQFNGNRAIIDRGLSPVINDLSPLMKSFFHTMALIKNLDLVITVDSIISHMAGVLGHPCWVPSPMYGIDWRMANGCYPNHRAFQQRQFGDWSAPFEGIERALRELVGKKAKS